MYAVWTSNSQEGTLAILATLTVVIINWSFTYYNIIVHLMTLLDKYKFPCEQEVVLFRCTSKGVVQHLTVKLTTSERNLEPQSITFNRGHGALVTQHEGAVLLSGRVVAVLQQFSAINELEEIFEYQSDVILNCTSMTKAVINCSSGNNYDVKELIPSSETLLSAFIIFNKQLFLMHAGIPNHPQLSYTVVSTDSSGQVVTINWQEPDNADSYDLDYYRVTIQPDKYNRSYTTKDTKISDYFNEGNYSVNVVVINRCEQFSEGSLEHFTVSTRTEGKLCMHAMRVYDIVYIITTNN
jgi:hypothetical protein